MENGYYEVFNQDNVTLVSVRETPIVRIVPEGIETTEGVHELDMIVFATGFDAFTGGVTAIDIRGVDGLPLKEKWVDGPRSYLNVAVNAFPNFFTATARSFCNYPRCAEIVVEWISACIEHMTEHGQTRVEATPEGEDYWDEHCRELGKGNILDSADSWFNGGNIPGKKRIFLLYPSTLIAFRDQLTDAAEDDYRGFTFSSAVAEASRGGLPDRNRY
jgi:cyclohexanone monooxygenase